METADITVIGAGIIGLAVSASLSKEVSSIYVLEKNTSFGEETSSRNSEVIHAGIYYPQQSLKAKTCVEGNQLTYQICKQNNIPHKRTGKLVIASEKEEIQGLERLLNNGRQSGVAGLEILDTKQINQIEPSINAHAALFSPNTGIVDSHGLMRYFFLKAKAKGVEFVFRSEVTAAEKQKDGYRVSICDADGTEFSFLTRILINCAGLNSDIIAGLVGIDIKKEDYTLKFCKGEYFRVSSAKSRLIQRLIYPSPDEKETSLGIHATPDLGGGLRLGPDALYIDRNKADYSMDSSKKRHFAHAVRRFLPFIEADDLTEDTCGIRPKLQGPEDNFRDFIICHEIDKGFPGLINLIGIDSPGLTCAVSIAKYVQEIVAGLF